MGDTEPEEDSSSSDSSDDEDSDDDRVLDGTHNDDVIYLQPIPTKKRRLMLRLSGVTCIESMEKENNRYTRESRERCGCHCQGGFCIPSHCACAKAGIPCQVDRESFPCGCTKRGCYNKSGRVEFDSDRVRNHYIKMLRKLRFEETGVVNYHPILGLTPAQLSAVPPDPQKSPYVVSMTADTENETNDSSTSNEIHPTPTTTAASSSGGNIVEYPCGICGKPCGENERCVFCDNCQSWIHFDCTPLSLNEFREMAVAGDDEPYICELCSSRKRDNNGDSFSQSSNNGWMNGNPSTESSNGNQCVIAEVTTTSQQQQNSNNETNSHHTNNHRNHGPSFFFHPQYTSGSSSSNGHHSNMTSSSHTANGDCNNNNVTSGATSSTVASSLKPNSHIFFDDDDCGDNELEQQTNGNDVTTTSSNGNHVTSLTCSTMSSNNMKAQLKLEPIASFLPITSASSVSSVLSEPSTSTLAATTSKKIMKTPSSTLTSSAFDSSTSSCHQNNNSHEAVKVDTLA